MNRRDFITTTVALAASTGLAEAGAPSNSTREYYELRQLTFESQSGLDRYAGFLKDAYITAVHRLHLGQVGAFTVADKPEALTIYTLQSFASLAAYSAFETHLLADAEYLKAGAPVLDLPAIDPPYTHADSSLLLAFEGWPKLTVPKETKADEPRVFELRTYESHSRNANIKKIEMFNKGESAIFARAGFQPVFFSEALTGPQVPNLTYMVTYPSIAARDGFWKAFGADPEKQRLFAIPEYSDKLIVSKIHSTFLKPIAGSLI